MATFNNPEAFFREVQALERDLENRRRDMGRAVAEAVRPEGYRAAARKLGGDPKFSGWKPWLELRVRTNPSGATLQPTRRSAGPWTVAEVGRNQMAGPSPRESSISIKTGRRKRAGRRFRRWNGQTAGFGVASDAKDRFVRAATDPANDEVRKVIGRHFSVT